MSVPPITRFSYNYCTIWSINVSQSHFDPGAEIFCEISAAFWSKKVYDIIDSQIDVDGNI